MSAEASDPAHDGAGVLLRQNHGSSLDGINDLEKADFNIGRFLRTYDKVLVNVKCDVAKKGKATDADIVENASRAPNTELPRCSRNRFEARRHRALERRLVAAAVWWKAIRR